MNALTPAQRLLVEEHLDIARYVTAKILRPNRWATSYRDDVYQEACLALMYAAYYWKPGRGSAFRT